MMRNIFKIPREKNDILTKKLGDLGCTLILIVLGSALLGLFLGFSGSFLYFVISTLFLAFFVSIISLILGILLVVNKSGYVPHVYEGHYYTKGREAVFLGTLSIGIGCCLFLGLLLLTFVILSGKW